MSCSHRWQYRKQEIGIDLRNKDGKYIDTFYPDVEIYFCEECGEVQDEVSGERAKWIAAVDEMLGDCKKAVDVQTSAVIALTQLKARMGATQ